MSLLGTSEPRPHMPPLREVTTLLNDAVSHRTELAAIELAEARLHARTSALLLGMVALLSLLAGLALTLTVAGLVWESPSRAWWLAGMCALYVVGAALAGWMLRRRLQTWQPFSEIRNQLQQDHQCLIRLAQSILP